ncbi:hypothetical protein BV22DRAFT_1031318 [Leucogyrophana mollusca]|uniref:Uncharacterized protein n=1 Tax=Leucogyrophana mollusca TaxID=85980 RepID=A0ACB8BQQ6_9AGAM|nr:hypothetical protein BV22DRAFT_1031318 [Leucogyrophana mollusca]
MFSPPRLVTDGRTTSVNAGNVYTLASLASPQASRMVQHILQTNNPQYLSPQSFRPINKRVERRPQMHKKMRDLPVPGNGRQETGTRPT